MTLLNTTLPEKLQRAEKEISRTYGAFTLFGLFEHGETPGFWDIVVAAPWLKADLTTIGQIVDLIRPFVHPNDWLSVARVLVLRPTDEFVQQISRLYHEKHGMKELGYNMFGGVAINHAYLITSNAHPIPSERQLTEAGASV